MKKIGILTYHRYYNYGTALQAYALKKYMNDNCDCCAELINYVGKSRYSGKDLIKLRIKRIFVYIRDFNIYLTQYKNRSYQVQKNKEFDEFFSNKMELPDIVISVVEDIKQASEKYDGIIIGSDQTWNPYVAFRKEFLLEYIDGNMTTKLSYAPSLGIGKVPTDMEDEYRNALSDFKALSCRERGGAAFLSELLGRKVEFVIDPTLLLNPEDWEDIIKPVEINEPYLLTYFLGDNKEHRKAAERIAREKNLKIVSLPISYLEMKNKAIDKRYPGPGGFVSLIKNASFICTDSFHGTMFSINFGKDFMSFPKRNDADINSDNNRLYDALEVFGLTERLGTGEKLITDPIDYGRVNEILNSLRRSSEQYLKNAIDEM